MGNGRRSKNSASGRVWTRSIGAATLLLLTATLVLRTGARTDARHAQLVIPRSPIETSAKSLTAAKPDRRAILEQLPLIFEPNQGQADADVRFLAQGHGYSLFLDATSAIFTTQSPMHERTGQVVRMKLMRSNLSAPASATHPLPGRSNYLIGSDPKKWHIGIPQFAGVRYQNVYPGIDLDFYGNEGRLEYDFRIAPGADPSQAELQFDGVTKLQLSGGDLILTEKDQGGLRLHAPQIYQIDGKQRKAIEGRFILRSNNRVAFEIGAYDRSRELVIDPVLTFSTYFGGIGSETFPSVAINGDGNIYLAGSTQSSPAASFPNSSSTTQTLIPSTLSLTTTNNHIFVTKIFPSQPPTVAYETFIGGSGSDTSVGLRVDNSGQAYIVGNTTSPDFPTSGVPYQTTPQTKGPQCASLSCTSVFVSVLNSQGSALNYSSYLSGNGNDQASGMSIDNQKDIFITGTTTSNDTPSLTDAFPATQLPVPFQSIPASSIQFFVTKVNTGLPGVSGIAYSTYFGGAVPSAPIAVGGGIANDSNGNVYFSGTTNFFNSGSGAFGDSGSGDFPILNAYQPCLDTPPPTILANANPCTAPATTPYPTDAFVAKLNPNGQAGAQLLFSTYLGGAGDDSSAAIAIDSGAANIYLTGSTNSTDFVLPTSTATFQGCLNNPGILVTTTTSCPATTSNTDAYVARFNNPSVSTTGTPIDVALTYFSYLGGSANDSGLAIAVDTANDALVTGSTQSTDFPVTSGPIQSALNGTQNAYFAHIDTTTTTGQNGVGSYVTYFGGNGVDRGTSITVDPLSLNTYFAGDTTSTTNLQTLDALQTTLNGPSDAFVVELGTATDICITCVAPTVSPAGLVSAGNPVTITFTVTNDGPDLATGVSVIGTVSTGVTFTSATAASGSCSTPVNNSVVCTIPTLQSGSTSAVTFVATPLSSGNFEATATVIKVNNTNTNITAPAPFTASDFSLSVSPTSQTIAAGIVAKYTVQLIPAGAFGANVSLTCGALPAATACSFINSTLTLNGNTQTVLNLQTTPQPVTTVGASAWQRPFYALWVVFPGMAFVGMGFGNKKRRSRVLGIFALALLGAIIFLQPSCSSSKATPPTVSGTPSGTYQISVTATSGSFSRTTSFQLTVTP
jgi:uncharacterized repeat protein (TIGR01451 family)